MFLVEDIEGGYFDKLRATPVSRTFIVMGRLLAEAVKGLGIAAVLVLVSLPFGIRIATGPVGLLLLIVLAALWAVVYAAFMQLVALRTRNAAATQSGGLAFFPLLFLTPNFVPRELLTRPMEIAASVNPVTYLMEAMRGLILGGRAWDRVALGFLVGGVLCAVVVALNVRVMRQYD